MTIIEIWKAKRDLYKIQGKTEIKEKYENIVKLANRVGAFMHIRHTESQETFTKKIIAKIHVVLQTEMMLQACIFAAASAFISLISVVLLLFFK